MIKPGEEWSGDPLKWSKMVRSIAEPLGLHVTNYGSWVGRGRNDFIEIKHFTPRAEVFSIIEGYVG